MENNFNVEEYVVQTYQENILFLKETQPRLYKKLQAFESALDQGLYTEKYELEYKEESYFDVKEKSTSKYLYGVDSYRYAQEATNSVNFKKEDNLFETFNNVHFSEERAKEIEKQDDFTKHGYATVVSLINYSHDHASKTETTMKKLYKYIFVGIGLGTHITKIHKKINSNIYLIIEDDIELFRLSLFVTNYKELTKVNNATLLFSVFDNEVEFSAIIQAFLREQFIYNHYIKFFQMLHHSDQRLKDIQAIIVTLPHISFNYSALMLGMFRPLEYLENSYNILNLNASLDENSLPNKPVLLIGAGPSFDKNLVWLQENHHKFVIVTVSALMSKFEDLKIKPDIVTHLHGFEDAMPHINKIKNMSFFDKTISVFSSMSYPPFVEKFKKENVFIFEGNSSYKENFGSLSAPNIGALSYGILLVLKIKELYLLGLDFAANQDTGETHSKTHAHIKNLELKLRDVGGGINARKEILEVEGNFQEKVYTTALLNSMKRQCNLVSKSFKNVSQNIYNLSDGAKIEDAIALHPDSEKIIGLERIDKEKLYKSLSKTLNESSENYLSKSELNQINKRLEYYDSIIKVLQEHLIKPHYNNINQYHYNLLGTFHKILTDNNKELSHDVDNLLTLYLELTSGYIFDLINTVEIEDEEQLIHDLNDITIPQIIRLVTFYKERIKSHIKNIKIV